MSKELPFFRFTVSEWLNDDISLEAYDLKGAFIDVCAYYWSQDCVVTIDKLKKRFSNATGLLEELIELGIIKVKNTSSTARISFLDYQYDMLSDKREKLVKAGRAGGLKKSSNAKASVKHRSSYNDKDNNKDNKKDKEYAYADFPFKSEEFIKTWEKWCNYRKEIGKKAYKEIGLKAVLTKLENISGQNEAQAIKIIENAIANSWQGLYELKDKQNGTVRNQYDDFLAGD